MKSEERERVLQNPEVKALLMAMGEEAAQGQKLEKVKKYKMLNQFVKKGETLFVGSSLMEYFPINELQQALDKPNVIYNRGIGGFVTEELLRYMEACIFELEPSKLFINIGTNDIASPDYKQENLLANYEEILGQIAERLPECQVYVMAYYPVNAKADFPTVSQEQKAELFRTRRNPAIASANKAIEQLAQKYSYSFINVNEGLTDEEGNLKEEYAIDGIHMWPNGYAVVLDNLKVYL
ncbi:lysophospholipase L1-like esterase [Pullulanibacillus pueri]|uniref:Lysophospholipase n=1 Tax=Pullulanibacillus pueri TaxID=1437324 RepID=A0A8J2ZY79_9BACL|nr:GDSL-type esterase/lipase family protein [Pullulanibacillus pueri]MBM7683321.1 lysophospholipase L1-like esterase [Pullulanibacillus pueri]GGH86400.1 lysophospholipase [Pullulanibacillus pueri]